jgi:tRNA nucleotidyltransferase (CCA-adding enzyme)
MEAKHWEHLPHEADIAVQGLGASKEQAFEQAALAPTAVIADTRELMPGASVEITCETPSGSSRGSPALTSP